MTAKFPEKLQFLFEQHRYKVIYGGRGKGGSWGFARAALILGGMQPLRILCARETQKSIADSVHALLSDQIKELGLESFYRVQEATILAANGTQFIFAGLKHNINNIKSIEACDIVWVEEAQNVSKESWEVLIPTIRKEKSEIWAGFNTGLVTDPTYKLFVLNPPPGAMVLKLSWRDNPWFPEVLRVEKDHLEKTDYKAYLNVWEGEPKSEVEGAIYGAELQQAEREGRICSVPYDRTKPVDTAWDLGFGDRTAIWFVQAYGGFYNFIDCLDGEGKTIADYCIQLQERKYLYGVDYLPHDAVDAIIHVKLASDRTRSIEMLMRNAGRKVRVVPKLLIVDGINAARTVFPQCRFDAEKCADGLQALRHYQWGEPSKAGVAKREPLHNWASHYADAFRGAAVAVKQPQVEFREPMRPPVHHNSPDAWQAL